MKFTGNIPKVPESAKKLDLPRVVSKHDNGHWLFPSQMAVNGVKGEVGFIYVIRDNELKRLYLGKKSYFGAGINNRGKESDWRRYKSSSKVLAELFKVRPKSEFDFICLEQYKTKGTLSYSETWSLCHVEAPTSDYWYNTLIEKVSWNVREGISQRHKDRLDMVLSWADSKEFI